MWRRRCPRAPPPKAPAVREPLFSTFFGVAPVIYIYEIRDLSAIAASPVAGRVLLYLSFCFGLQLPFLNDNRIAINWDRVL